jgi:protein-L-isoaspartate(D-aspartate) O-methyltransferase
MASAVDRMEFQLNLRRRGIADAIVLRAMDDVPRALFVGSDQADFALEDRALPIACGQTISQPYVVALMTEALRVHASHRVLEVGTGSGYQAAILGRIAREVVSVERFRTLAEAARARLAALGLANVSVLHEDAMAGLPGQGTFDRVMVTAAAPVIPDALMAHLAEDGILVAPLGPPDGPQMLVRQRKRNGTVETERLVAVRFVPLVPGRAREL